MENTSQIHLLASEKGKQINEILNQLTSGRYEESFQKSISESLRFFGKNITILKECNDTMLQLCKVFCISAEKKLVDWPIREFNAALMLVTGMLLKRSSNEDFVRNVCFAMEAFIKLLTDKQLKCLVKIHQKHVRFILHKMTKVVTYYTQVKLLGILHSVLSVLEDSGEKIIEAEGMSMSCSREIISDMTNYFHILEDNDLNNTFRDHLVFYNEHFVKTQFIFTIPCYLFEINEKTLVPQELFVDFNLRNLSISFFLGSDALGSNEVNISYLIEMEEVQMTAEKNKFKNPKHIELFLKSSRSKTLNVLEDKNHFDILVESVLVAVTDKFESFWTRVFPYFQDRTPLLIDNATDQESIVSFRTVNTVIIDGEVDKTTTTQTVQKPLVVQKQLASQTQVPIYLPEPQLPDVFTAEDLAKTSNIVLSQMSPKQTQKTIRKTMKVEPTFTKKNNVYDKVPRDDEALPSAKQFLVLKRLERGRKTQGILNQVVETAEIVPESWQPRNANEKKRLPPKKRAASAPKKTQQQQKQRKRFSSEVEDEIKDVFGEALFPSTKGVATKRKTPQRKAAPKKELIVDSSSDESDEVYNKSYADAKAAKPSISLKKNSQKASQACRAGIAHVGKSSLSAKTFVPQVSINKPVVPPKPVQACKRPGSEIEKSCEAKKGRVVFDTLLEKKTTSPISKTRLIKKRVSFDDEVIIFKRTQSESSKAEDQIHNDPSIMVNLDDTDLEDKEASFEPYTQYRKPHDNKNFCADPKLPGALVRCNNDLSKPPEEIKHNLKMLEKNDMLSKFIIDTMNHKKKHPPSDKIEKVCSDQAPKQNNIEFDSYAEKHSQVRVQKTSPTVIRTVQIQEINYSSPNSGFGVQKRKEVDGILQRKFEKKLNEAWKPLKQKMIRIKESVCDIEKPELKAKVRQAVYNLKASQESYQTHAKEHARLLKRLQSSKFKLNQLFKEDQENFGALQAAVKEMMNENRNLSKNGLTSIEEIKTEIAQKHQQIKQEVWNGYIDDISNHFIAELNKHKEF